MQINGWKIRELLKGTLQSFNGGMSWLWCNFFHLTDAVCFVAMYHLIISEFLQNALVGQLEHTVYPNQYPGVPNQKAFPGEKDGGLKIPTENNRTTQGHQNFTLMEKWITMRLKDPSALKMI